MPEKQREPERSTDYWNGFEDGQAAATAQPVPPCGHCGHLDGHAINCDAPSPVLTPAQITIGVPTIETFNESLPGTMRPEATFVKSERPVLTQPSAEPSALQKLAQEGIAYKRECIRLQGIIDKLKAERPVLPVPPLTRFSVYPWLNETIKVSGWNVGRFIQFCEEHEHMDDLADTIIAWQARASSPAPTERCPSCGSREKAYRLCMIENCGEPHFEETIFSSTHMKAVCSDSWHTAAPAATKEK